LGSRPGVNRLVLVALLWVAVGGTASALDPRKAISEYHRQSWQTQHGLPQSTVYDTAQTKDGYLWFATIGGLARFDGVRFTSFLPTNTPGLKNGIIWTLFASRDGGLWIGTEGGLTRYKDGVFTTYTTADGLVGDAVATLHEDRYGAVWLGSSVAGLTRLRDGRFERFGLSEGLPDTPVKAIADDAEGNLWVGTSAGLYRLRDGRVTASYTAKDGLGEDRVSALYVDRHGVLWVGASGGGKTRVEDGRFTRYPPAAAPGAGIFSIREDHDGQIWFATAGAGLERLHDGRLSIYKGEEFSALRSLCVDREGNLWVGTSSYGVFRLKDTPLVTYSIPEGLLDKTVRSVAQLPNGRILIANRYHLRAYEGGPVSQGGRFSSFPMSGPLSGVNIYPLFVDRAGNLWVGTTNFLARLAGGKWTSFLEDKGSGLYVHALHQDREGRMWAGTEQGLYAIEGEKVTRYTTADGLASDQIFAIDQDVEGALWFGTRGGGVSRLHEGRFTSYTTADGLSGQSIRAIYADADGSVWIGTSGEGLTRFRAGKFSAYRASHGLFDQSVSQIVDDGHGHLWLCGVEGITRVAKKHLNDVADGRGETVAAQAFGVAEGMRAKTCHNAAQPASGKMRDGRIWFTTADGMVVVDPADLGRRNGLAPPVLVEAVRVDRRPLGMAPGLELAAGSREIELEYTALSFVAPEKVRFKYRLDGYDRDWIDPGTRRIAYYMNLRPGDYTFRVQAANEDGVWNESGAAVSFRLKPRFHETVWFLVLCGIGVVLAAWGVMDYRMSRLQTRQIELAAHVAERTRELQQEIGERKRVEEALRESEERYSLAVRGANDGVWDWNLKTDHIYYSPRWKAILGYEDEDVGDTPQEWLDRVHTEDVDRVKAKILAHCDGRTPHFEDEHRVRHKDGSHRWVLTRGFAVRNTEGQAYRLVGAQTDVTDRRSYDPLTGLPNRALFVERLVRALTRTQRSVDYKLAVLFLDLDRFKLVNDSLGHLAGDRLIVSIARELDACVRPGDMIARFGGDEFAVLVDNITGVADALRIAERIQDELHGIFSIEGSEVFASASIGIALSSTGYDSAEDLLRDADTAMYRAKANGRGRYEVFDETMRAQVMAQLELESEFRRAVERRDFRVYYQPIVDLEGGTLRGFEALVRWQHPRRGIVMPDQFIGIAEETGLILPVGYWVLEQACRQLREWHEQMPEAAGLSLSVNISGRQFKDRELVQRIGTLLKETGLEPCHLILEITESVVMDAEGAASAMLSELDALGVRIHIDDFGTGYSSLSYLHRFPVDGLKIDRSFVAKMTESGGDALVRTILTLAHNLGIPAVAEGVESADQVQALRALGCEQAQGHFFSMAVPAAEASTLVKSGRHWWVQPQADR
jgi:diguanylate cyclase (GGDEF)-like protein/PAS domain S-box-containing protein